MDRTRVSPDRWAAAPSVPAGIYGTVICAATLASSGEDTAGRVAVTVLVTLFVYWLAERYAELLGAAAAGGAGGAGGAAGAEAAGGASGAAGAGGAGGGPGLDRDQVLTVLTAGWAMIQASVTPLLVLLIARLSGASNAVALDAALIYTVVLLVVLGWLAAGRAGLSRWARWTATAFAGLLGGVVVALKVALH